MARQPIGRAGQVRSVDVPKRSSRPLAPAAIAVVVALVVAVGGYLVYRHVTLGQNGCQTDNSGEVFTLDPGQAAIASTIAGVAHARRLPAGAVTIAYATAIQESHLHNLRYGDLDSVGVFQQRPSEGWGTARQLADPVFAAGKFFGALTKVPNYLRMPVYQAAQAVQHSADGSAYANYQAEAASLSRAFTGGRPHSVWCWYPRGNTRSPHISPLRQQLDRTFGRLAVRPDRGTGSDPAAAVRVHFRAAGWAVASWLVTHATQFGISNVAYAGYEWNAAAGSKGWTRDRPAPANRVELR
jgi:hypothetical protein